MPDPPTLPHGPEDAHPSSTLELENYNTLKQSLSASLKPDGFSPALLDDDYFASKATDGPPKSSRASPPVYVELPKLPTSAETALTALQYLPTPILVLSNLKTVILANDAMGLLVGLDNYNSEEGEEDDGVSVGDLLRGQTLSQIGIDLIQDGQPIWVSWEVRISI